MQLLAKSSTDTLAQQTNLVRRYIDSINWDAMLSSFVTLVFELLFFTILFWLINRIGKRILRHSFTRYQAKRALAGGRISTIETLATNAFSYLVGFFYFYAILSTLGVPVGTLIAGAGVLSLAIGLGAQGFVNDVVTGFFIILEGQLDVGDSVQLNQISGTVTSVGLRTTIIKSADGTMNFIPNRNISIVSNRSRNNMLVSISLPVEPNVDVHKLTDVINQVNTDLVPKYQTIIKAPDLLGIAANPDGTFSYQIQMYAENGEQLNLQRTFLSAYLNALTQAGITIPQPKLNLK
ncbi:mechanosensitive ion channel family protein [Lacticaseibacillus saniviri]|uniref:Small-conductance mechanosensitive channel protein n=1 Tax=Lacticaseibacillus saniviri JCM 17471 = DSM 24301 TaxID=1293598 RepID=A0A0R2MWE5_9LACO|nr:mechanosensitive ion channel family protein [Lacticaseibacillus saniviri]KRO17950.1 small-conductance mechanosensitive channel protein [Lacticaseibacillus saniviri JCM 17471 = DSM 24301]MCG4281733.1 mechanosensitive ion channel family protein [Lacticaseibacillus saniviri]